MTRPTRAILARRAARHVPLLGLLLGLLPAAAAATESNGPARTSSDPERGAFEALRPGEFVTHALDVPVRVVLVGFDEGRVDEATLLESLPSAYRPLVRFPQFYGLSGRELGLEYRFRYRLVRKDERFARRFFTHLAAIGRPGPRTLYQSLYNAQANKLPDVEVSDEVLLIDAPSVERWLETNDAHGERGYTVYFVNWYGRDGFRFHVYTRGGDPDPDTGFDFAALSSRKMVSWGGSSGRSWFYDFSAGPEFWGAS
jgi:hypothetical protein